MSDNKPFKFINNFDRELTSDIPDSSGEQTISISDTSGIGSLSYYDFWNDNTHEFENTRQRVRLTLMDETGNVEIMEVVSVVDSTDLTVDRNDPRAWPAGTRVFAAATAEGLMEMPYAPDIGNIISPQYAPYHMEVPFHTAIAHLGGRIFMGEHNHMYSPIISLETETEQDMELPGYANDVRPDEAFSGVPPKGIIPSALGVVLEAIGSPSVTPEVSIALTSDAGYSSIPTYVSTTALSDLSEPGDVMMLSLESHKMTDGPVRISVDTQADDTFDVRFFLHGMAYATESIS